MKRLAWTAPALADLRGIDEWLTAHRDGEFAARTLASVRARARFLEGFPHGGRPILKDDFRILRVSDTPYLIIYRIVGEQLQLLRIRHEREDWRPE